MDLLAELEARGLVHQTTQNEERPLPALLSSPTCVYAGFDPTASSLHVGNLVPLLGLRRFQLAGHRVIALAGGATGMVGDPSGRSSERNLLDREQLAANVAAIKGQLERLLDLSPGKGELVDNLDWTGEQRLLDFLRDTGKHFHVNVMIKKDSVRDRLEREGEGISFTEFSYMLLQAQDFLWLFERRGCKLQVGGSDQWGNITAGVELIRRRLSGAAYGLTFPLLQNTDGSKFGKSVAGAVWLDPARTSPFAFRQFWFKTADEDVVARLKTFTFLPLEEIAALEQGVREKSAPNAAQRRLARAMTALVHGVAEAERVERAVEVFFDPKGDLREMPAEFLEDAFAGAPVEDLPRERLQGQGLSWLDLVAEVVPDGSTGKKGKSAARRMIEQKAVSLNGQKLAEAEAVTLAHLLHGRYLVLRRGKNPFLVRVA